MDAPQLSFMRHEKKYLLSPQQYDRLRARLEPHFAADQYGMHTILSLYYDTPDYALIRRSLERPVYKEKLRLRAYGVPGPDDRVFVELKKKFDGVVYKRRIALPLHLARDCLQGRYRPVDEPTVRELAFFLGRYPLLRPAALLCYDRVALFGREDRDLRVTFDRNIRARAVQLDLAKGDWGGPVLPPDRILMELKLPLGAPLWLARLLSEEEIFPARFSKYGAYYQEALAPLQAADPARKKVVPCA